MAMFAMPTGDTERLGSDNYEFSTIGPPTFPGAVAFPIQDTKTKVTIKWPTIDPKKGTILPPINDRKAVAISNGNAPAPKDFPILSLTVSNLEKPKKKEEHDSDVKFAEDLPAIMIKQLKAMKPTGSLQFIPDHDRSETAFFTESNWSESDRDEDDMDDIELENVQRVHHNNHNDNNDNNNNNNNNHSHQSLTHQAMNTNHLNNMNQPANINTNLVHKELKSNVNKGYKSQQPHKRMKSAESHTSKASMKSMGMISDVEHIEFQHDINDILSLSIKDKFIYMVLDHCISIILDVWNATQIATKTATDIEAELLLNASGLYETLLDYFYNSPTAICSAIHQLCCKIHVMRLLMEGTKMIHIPSNLEEFEKTFGDLTSIRISTILGKKRRKLKKKKSFNIKRVRIQSVSKEERKKSIAKARKESLPNAKPQTFNFESMEAKQDRVSTIERDAGDAGVATPTLKRLKTLERKIQSMNSEASVTSLADVRYNKRSQTREALANRLRNALKELIFQHRKTYFEFFERKQFKDQIPDKNNAKVSDLSTESQNKLHVKTMTPISRQMTKMFKNQSKRGSSKNLHPTARCEGCGQMMDINDEILQNTVITYEVPCTNSTFFFHDEICVNLRKYKEIIRKYVSESKLAANKKSKNLPQYIKNLMQNFNSLIGIHDHETLSRPYNPFLKKNAHASTHSLNKVTTMKTMKTMKTLFPAKTKSMLASRRTSGRTSNRFLEFEDDEDEDSNYDSDIYDDDIELTEEEMAHLSLIQREREIACIALSRDKNNAAMITHKNEFDDIPLSIQICDINIYGIVLWEFVMQQLLTKQMHSLWLLLAYLSSELSTKRAIDLLDEHLADIAKVKNVENLELVCAAILGNASYPIASALHLSHFISSVAENDLSRKDEFKRIADRYTCVAEKLVECVESDHLLSLFLEAPTNFNMNSIFDIAIDYEMEDFFDNNRVGRIMDHMWSTFDFLNPSLNYRTREIDLYELLNFVFSHPAQFYYTPVGRYWTKSLMYILYVILITFVAAEQAYLHKKVTSLESGMWICNIGYILFEIMEMTFRGIEYFSDYTNYFDIFIILNWTILGVMRFGLYAHLPYDEKLDDGVKYRNASATLVYMVVFGVQICVLYCRITTIFIRTKNLGPFIRMIGEMLEDVLNFAFVALIFFLGFTVAIRYIFEGDVSTDCGSDTDINGPYTASLFVFITLMGQLEWSALDANSCFTETRAMIAQCFIVVFSILGTMLLVNLLIAMMATTYNEKLDAKAKEVNYYRTEEVYQLAHEQAIISPPLNMLVFASVIVWYIFEFILYCVSTGKYCINIALITPVDIDYNEKKANDRIVRKRSRKFSMVQPKCCGLLVEYPASDGNINFSKQFCQYCKIYMEVNGNISDYLALFKGYQLDKDDVKVIKNMFANQGLCPKCFRPYKLYPDGKSNRLARWQVIIEILSFYAFFIFIYVPMMMLLTVPALFVGFWGFMQDLANSNVEKRMAGHTSSYINYDSHIKQNRVGRNYKQLIRNVIEQQTTSEMDRLHQKLDQITEMFNEENKLPQSNPHMPTIGAASNNDESVLISKQYNQLAMMVASINSRIDVLMATRNEPQPKQQKPQQQQQQQQQNQLQVHRQQNNNNNRNNNNRNNNNRNNNRNNNNNNNNSNNSTNSDSFLKPAGKLEALSSIKFSGR